MKTKVINAPAIATGVAVLSANLSRAAAALSVDDLIEKIKSKDDKVRGPAWQSADQYGAPAVKPLAAVMADPEFETARCAKRAVWKIVRAAGQPSNAKAVAAVELELIALLANNPANTRREVLWMLSEIGSDKALAPMAALLTDPELREDARCALMRLPGPKVTAAFKKAFATAPEEFKFALAESLRQRGDKVAGYPSKKLVPTKQTTVTQTKKT
jgi:HEAT repeat protein